MEEKSRHLAVSIAQHPGGENGEVRKARRDSINSGCNYQNKLPQTTEGQKILV